jgi:hypothetical protein
MSADNWGTCPKCRRLFSIYSEKRREEILNSYGKIPEADYLSMRDELARKKAPVDTLREDYEIGIINGVFSIDYSAECSECGFKFRYKYEVDALSGSKGDHK